MKNKYLQEFLQKYPDDVDVVLNSKYTIYHDDIDIDIIKTRYCDDTELFYKMNNLDDEDWRRETKKVLMIY
jgi:hypothetical protein